MIDPHPKMILYIEPTGKATKPIIDDMTISMYRVFKKHTNTGILGYTHEFSTGMGYMGVHTCVCGANSTSCEYLVEDKYLNYLCVHYMASHRGEIPEREMNKVKKMFDKDCVELTKEEEKELMFMLT
jgi:hypothetical protein